MAIELDLEAIVGREPRDAAGRIARWIAEDARGKSGAYLYMTPDGRPLYAGASSTGRLEKTAKRHLFEWRRSRSSAPTGPVYQEPVLLALWPTDDGPTALAIEAVLIEELRPPHNALYPARAETDDEALAELSEFFDSPE